MSTFRAVIGAGYGDEGKGQIVHSLSGYHDAGLIVRHSGGANAGHTVQLNILDPSGENEERIRHVFHHFGSATLRRANTFLGKRFVVNPILYRKERTALQNLLRYKSFVEEVDPAINGEKETWLSAHEDHTFVPTTYVDSRAFVTTPMDMLLNEMRESGLRHGSCGTGINETMVRCGQFMHTVVNDFKDLGQLEKYYNTVREIWVPQRMKDAGLDPKDHERRMDLIASDTVRDNWLSDCQHFWDTTIRQEPKFVKNWNEVIFEGSQGLLLDSENREFFPHLTNARTGLTNVVEFMDEVGTNLDEVYYVTRTYMTRHGNGPFPTESEVAKGFAMRMGTDETNKENQWQGPLRYGDLDYPRMKAAIDKDTAANGIDENGSAYLAVTWLGYDPDNAESNGAKIAERLGLTLSWYSTGPTEDDMYVV